MSTKETTNRSRTPMLKNGPVKKIATIRSKGVKKEWSRHRREKTVDPGSSCEYTVTPNQIPFIVAQLRAKGKHASFIIFMFEAQVGIKGQSGNMLNLQYAIQDGKVGLEWVLLCARNIEDNKRLIKFITQRGHTVTEQELNGVRYLRVEEGDIIELGTRIVTELYQLECNAEIGLLVNGFEYKLDLKMADVMRFVRLSASQQGFIADLERISAVLHLINGKSASQVAFAEFETFLGSIRFTDIVDDKFNHRLLSEIKVAPRTKKLEEELLGNRGINLLSACGYRHFFMNENFQKWFSGTNDKDFRELAEFCVGVLHLLFDHQLGHPLGIDFFMPGSDLEKLPKWAELPEPMQASYGTFMSCYHGAMVKYHKLMAIESPTLSKSQMGNLIEASAEMENVLEEFPSWITKLKELGPACDNFHSFATDNKTELIESLNVLRRRYKTQMLH